MRGGRTAPPDWSAAANRNDEEIKSKKTLDRGWPSHGSRDRQGAVVPSERDRVFNGLVAITLHRNPSRDRQGAAVPGYASLILRWRLQRLVDHQYFQRRLASLQLETQPLQAGK